MRSSAHLVIGIALAPVVPRPGERTRRQARVSLKAWASRDDQEAMALRLTRARRLVRARLREEAGYTLFELLVVVTIMGVVLAGLTTSFAAGLNAEAGTIRRAEAQQNARIALDRMKLDIHCASGAPATMP